LSGKVVEGDILWTPGEDFARASNMHQFMQWLAQHRGHAFADYESLWQWSVRDLEGFWSAIWDYFEIRSTTPWQTIVDRRSMPGARWFVGAQVNFTEHLLRHEEKAAPDEAALLHLSELRPQLAAMSWHELGAKVRKLATRLRRLGLARGDRVVAYMPNIPETAIAMMAVTAIGAIWASAAPEFGTRTVLDRFGQIKPRLMFVADGYRFAGKDFHRRSEIADIVAGLPDLETLVYLPYLSTEAPAPNFEGITTLAWDDLFDGPEIARESFEYDRVPHDHPLWILFSSGTTGLPKAIVHSHVGILLEQMKGTAFHVNLSARSRMFFYSTTGWVMWNALISAMLQGSSIVLFDGHPAYPDPSLLWRLAAESRATAFGASPTFVLNMQKLGLRPGEIFDLSAIDTVLCTGSPATPETFAWFYESVKRDLWMTSQSGGTEICGGLVGAVPFLPVRAGEIQARCLGMDVHAWSETGEEVIETIGELVLTSPAPSMPLYFWNDADGRRYHESYFDVFPGVWRHGDFIKITNSGSSYIYGRSDATLNRYGVRIGSAEIYRCLDLAPKVADSLIVCVELDGGAFYMPLFVRLKEGAVLDDSLRKEINESLRNECSPRHVPDEIIAVPAIPYTLTGKKMEVPVRKLLLGQPAEKVAARDAMMDPDALDWFAAFAAKPQKKVS
jgi:acetoacetyl-CoA synthetase